MKYRDLFKDETKKKIIIIDKSSYAYYGKRSLVDKYGLLLNTYFYTIDQFCEYVTQKIRYDLRKDIATKDRATLLVESIMNSEDLDLNYFKKSSISLNTYTEMLQTINELKRCKILPEDEGFKRSEKLKEVCIVYKRFLYELENDNLLDHSDLLALEFQLEEEIVIFTYENTSLLPLEKEFLHKVSKNMLVFPLPKPKGLNPPKDYHFISQEDIYSNPILDLFHKYTPLDDLEMVRAYGTTNEVDFVFRDILSKNIPFDQCHILYTGTDYVEYLRNASSLYNIPITLQEGYKLDSTKPYFFLSQLIFYIINGSNTRDIKVLFDSGVIHFKNENLKDKNISNRDIINYILKCNIDNSCERIKKKIGSKLQYEKEVSKEIGEVAYRFIDKLSSLENTYQDTNSYLLSILDLMQEYTLIDDENPMDKIAYEAIVDLLREYINGPCIYPNITSKWLYELELRVRGARKDLHQPREGHIHVSKYSNTLLSLRSNLYIIGLDANHFPDTRNEASILNNSDRKKLSENLPLQPLKRDASYRLLEVLGSHNGKMTFLYNFYDTVNVREINPSSFMQMLFKNNGVNEENIHERILTAGFIPQDKEKSTCVIDELLMDTKGFLKEDMLVDQKKSTLAEDFVFSPSSIEMLVQCRNKFHYRYIKGLLEPEREINSDHVWIDALERGNLIHSIFEDCIQYINNNGRIDDEKIQNIVLDNFQNTAQKIPFKVKAYYNGLLRTFLDATKRYVKEYSSKYNDGSIVMSDSEFRFDDIQITITNKETLKKQILLRGKVDRIDYLKDNMISIIDYKTGKYFDHKDGNEKKFQDVLYEEAVNEKFRLSGSNLLVKEFKYEFPLEEDEDKKYWTMREEDKEAIKASKMDIIFKALDEIQNSNFTKLNDNIVCGYCPYTRICRPQFDGGDGDD